MDSNGMLGNGFKVLPVKFNEKSQAVHFLYYKVHNVRDPHPEKPNDKTLFMINLPPYVDEDCLRRLFHDCGTIDRVFFHEKPTSDGTISVVSTFFPQTRPITGYKLGYLVFRKKSQVRKAMGLDASEPRILFDGQHPPLVGIRKWCQEYNQSFPDCEAIQREIDIFMDNYDKKVKEEVEKEKEMDGVPDDEGWITVTKHGRKPAIPRTEAQNRKLTTKEKKKRAEKELLNFYAFQIRESKMENIAQLRKKFEEDKHRIALLKASRKFRPY